MIDANTLLNAYANGVFPMADDKDDGPIYWYEPKLRGIIPMDAFKVSKNVHRLIRNGTFEIKINHDFESVIRACREREESWISEEIIASYVQLHKFGYATSVEIYTKHTDKLIGGLYGVQIAKAFFGESMFKREAEMDKIALWYCYKHLQKNGIELWDTQFWTPHLSQFGCVEITQQDYLELLEKALFNLSSS